MPLPHYSTTTLCITAILQQYSQHGNGMGQYDTSVQLGMRQHKLTCDLFTASVMFVPSTIDYLGSLPRFSSQKVSTPCGIDRQVMQKLVDHLVRRVTGGHGGHCLWSMLPVN